MSDLIFSIMKNLGMIVRRYRFSPTVAAVDANILKGHLQVDVQLSFSWYWSCMGRYGSVWDASTFDEGLPLVYICVSYVDLRTNYSNLLLYG